MPESAITDLLLLHHSHTDIGYTHAQDNVFALNRDYIRHAMRMCQTHADGAPGERFIWTCETTIMVEDFLRHATPAEIDQFVALNRQGLLGIGGMYVNTTPLFSAEMLARTLYAAGRLRRDYGLDVRYALNCDVNGQSWGLVEMLLDSGFDGLAMAINRAMAREPAPRPVAFWWQGPSGRRILTWHGAHYGDGNNLGIPRLPVPHAGKRRWVSDLEGAHQQVGHYLQKLTARGYPYAFAYLQIVSTVCWDNDGPDESLVTFVREWNQRGYSPRLHIVALDGLFERLRALPEDALETRVGAWDDWWAQGVGASAFETALARHNHHRLTAVQGLAAALQPQPTPPPYPHDADQSAWHSLALYDEHTWGAWECVTHPDSIQSRGGWYRKAVYAYESASAITRLVQRMGRNLTARLDPAQPPRVAVYNPLPWPRRAPLFLPPAYETGWEVARLERDLENLSAHGSIAPTVDYGVVDLPAGGYVTVPLRYSTAAPLSANPQRPSLVPTPAPGLAPTTSVHAFHWTLSNPFCTLTVDPATGAISSLTDAQSGHEWVDHTTPWGLGHFIFEDVRSPRQRDDMMGEFPPADADFDHRAYLAARRQGPEAVRDYQIVRGVGNTRLCLRLDSPGVDDLHIQMVLYDDLPWIDLIYDFDKRHALDPVSVYIAFPFALESPRFHYEVAGAVVEAERQQISIACRDYYAVQNWVDVEESIPGGHAPRGVTLATPDAPLLHFGGFTNHRYGATLSTEQPLVVGWPLNNHWGTNFPAAQRGWMRVRYRLMLRTTPFDPAVASRFGAEAAVDPLILPVQDRYAGSLTRTEAAPIHLTESASFFRLEPSNVALVALKPAEDGRGVIVRLQELSGQPTAFTLHMPLGGIASATPCTLLEADLTADGEATFATTPTAIAGHVGAHRLTTFRVQFLG